MDATGHYSILLGSASKDGVPADIFASGEARWLGVKIGDAAERPRVLLVSVPYALKAGDAETLGGKPLSAFLLAPDASAAGTSTDASASGSASRVSAHAQLLTAAAGSPATAAGTQNYIAKFDSTGTNLINSSFFDNGLIGIGTTTPSADLHIYRANPSVFATMRLSSWSPYYYTDFQQNTGGTGATVINQVNGLGTGKILLEQEGSPVLSVGNGTNAGKGYVGIGSFGFYDTFPSGGPIADLDIYRANPNSVATMRLESWSRAYATTIKQDASGVGATVINQSNAVGTGKIVFQQEGSPVLTIGNGTNAGKGNVGIGSTAPSQPLTVAGIVQSTSGGFMFPDGSVLTSATMPTVTSSYTYNGTTTNQILYAVQNQTGQPPCTTPGQQNCGFEATGVPSGLRGDSTSTSGYAAGVFGSAASPNAPGVAGVNLATTCPGSNSPCAGYGIFGWSPYLPSGVGVWGQADAVSGAANVGVYGQSAGDGGTGLEGYACWGDSVACPTANTTGADGTGVFGLTAAPNGTGVWGQASSATGNTVGVYGQIGTKKTLGSTAGVAGLFDAPTGGTLLEGRVVATAGGTPTEVFHVDAAGNFTAKTFNPGGADFAEAVDAIGGGSKYEPGDVMMIDETGTRRLALASEPYSTKVAGIYSTAPGVLASEHPMNDPRIAKEVPLAIVGIVPCKVSAENGAIHAGDLLVTSSIPGYAMKGTDRNKMLGAIVGKALGSLDKGTGTIEVLVSLH